MLKRRFTTYGFSPQADWVASGLAVDGFGMGFDVSLGGRNLGSVRLPLPGRHNVQNALATLAVADELEVPFEQAAAALESFGGVERRFQRKGSASGIEVIDDYAHHPAEVRATLAAARELHDGRIVAIFQPHRYTRTRDSFDEFATAFNDADRLIVTDIYAAGDDPIPGITSEALCQAITDHGHRDARHLATLEQVAGTLAKQLEAGDWVLTLGAGDVSKLGPMLLERLGGGDAP
jgi:UDP-N-acetylmuramate--alanine ligase